jgi:hypothetical protein
VTNYAVVVYTGVSPSLGAFRWPWGLDAGRVRPQ